MITRKSSSLRESCYEDDGRKGRRASYTVTTQKQCTVFVNGKYAPELSEIHTDEPLIVQNFADAYAENATVIDQYFAKYADYQNDSFTALNTAFAHDGAFISVPKGLHF